VKWLCRRQEPPRIAVSLDGLLLVLYRTVKSTRWIMGWRVTPNKSVVEHNLLRTAAMSYSSTPINGIASLRLASRLCFLQLPTSAGAIGGIVDHGGKRLAVCLIRSPHPIAYKHQSFPEFSLHRLLEHEPHKDTCPSAANLQNGPGVCGRLLACLVPGRSCCEMGCLEADYSKSLEQDMHLSAVVRTMDETYRFRAL